jgi:hypothetical protein
MVCTTTSAAAVAVGGRFVGTGVSLAGGGAVGGGDSTVTDISTVVVICTVPVISGALVGIAVGLGVMGVLVGSGVLVGRMIQDTAVGARFSKVGHGVRVACACGRRCSASWVKAVLKMI